MEEAGVCGKVTIYGGKVSNTDCLFALDVNYEFVGDCHINIAVKKKGAAVKIA